MSPRSAGPTPARLVAQRVLRAVREQDAYANLVLPGEITRAGLADDDARFATELSYGTLRMLGTYDAFIAVAAGRPVAQIDPLVLDVLRLGAHQVFATRVPRHAAVNQTVALARSAGRTKATGFVNAVMRRLTEEPWQTWLERSFTAARSDDERLAIEHSHPVWVIRAFRRSLAARGEQDRLIDLLQADNHAPAVTLAALPGLSADEVAGAHGLEPTPYSPLGFRAGHGAPAGLVEESEGALRIQDEGSQLAALALVAAAPVQQGERWLDVCAGPGGKSALLAAEAVRHGATFVANEVAPHRAVLVRDSVRAVPAHIPVLEHDGRALPDLLPERFDRVLLDAPCTGLGALRRRPEARWRKRSEDLADLIPLQAQLLDAAFEMLVPGGVLAYVTCSPHLAETVEQIDAFCARHGGAVERLDTPGALDIVVRDSITHRGVAGNEDRSVQLWPHEHGTDAMFIALVRRTLTSRQGR